MLAKSDVQSWDPSSLSHSRKGVFPLVILAFPLFLSVGLDNFSPALDSVINAWKILSTVVVVAWYIDRLVTHKPTPAHIVPMAVVMAMLLFSTLANSGSMQRYLVVWGGFFAVGLLVEAKIKERPLQLLLALKVVLGTLAILNCFTVLVQPEGLWTTETEGYWLLGHRNNFGAPLIAALVASAAYDFLSRRRLTVSTIVIATASLVSVALTWSASSVLTIVLTLGVILLIAMRKSGLRAPRPFLLLVLYALIDIGIVVFQIQERASDFITEVLDRSADLTGRTRIWDIVFGMIQDSPLFGNGVQLTENNGLTMYNSNFVHAHNGELDILMQGGLLTFIPFVTMIILATLKATKHYDHRAIQILYIGLILIMARSITGLFFSSYAVLIVFLLLNSGTIARLASELAPARNLLSPGKEISSRRGPGRI